LSSVRWVHTADLHLDQPLKGWKGSKEEVWKRYEEHRQTFSTIISTVKEKNIPFLFISGDFLEHSYTSRSTLEFVLEQFSLIKETFVWIAPGNHDPFRHDSIYQQKIWPENVHIFGGKWERHTFSQYDLEIYGRGFLDFEERQAHLPDQTRSDARKIMVVHGDYSKNKQKSSYFPIWEEDLAKYSFDYVALGHIHKPSEVRLKNARNTIVHYPGSPEAHTWKELGERTVTMGELTKRGVEIERIPVHTKTFEWVVADLTGLDTKEKQLEKIMQTLPDEKKDSYITLELSGRRFWEGDWEQDRLWILHQLQQAGFSHVYLEDRTTLDFDFDYYRKQNNLLGLFVRKMEERIRHAEDAKQRTLFENALYKGIEALLLKGKL
jgi:exonuclease SbcD